MNSFEIKEEKKGGEAKLETEFVSENLVALLADFINSPSFRRAIETFYEEIGEIMRWEGDSKDDVDEFSHEHKEAFDDFEVLVDSHLSQFADGEGVSLSSVYQCCKDTVEGRYAPLFSEDENLWVVETLLSYLDFQHFIKAVKAAAKSKRK